MAQRVAIIPARLGSTRFPEKVLASETGRPLIVHVCDAAAAVGALDRIVVATDSERVADAVRAAGYDATLTGADHPNGASRLGEAADRLELADGDVVVNVQGDEPEIEPAVVEAAIAALESGDCPVSTVGSPFAPGEDPESPSIVKVVRRLDGRALYFSRALIPHDRDGSDAAPPLKHVGLYAYRRAFLRTYATLAPTALERAEMLEQLRILDHGYAIAVAVERASAHGIDTPGDYRAFVERWRARQG